MVAPAAVADQKSLAAQREAGPPPTADVAAAAALPSAARIEALQRPPRVLAASHRLLVLAGRPPAGNAVASLVATLNEAYARHHGHGWLVRDMGSTDAAAVAALETALDGRDWVLWLRDGAVCLGDSRLSLEPLLHLADGADLVVARAADDQAASCAVSASGALLLRVTAHVRALLASWRATAALNLTEALNRALEAELPLAAERVHRGNLRSVLDGGYPVRGAHFCVVNEHVLASARSALLRRLPDVRDAATLQRLQTCVMQVLQAVANRSEWQLPSPDTLAIFPWARSSAGGGPTPQFLITPSLSSATTESKNSTEGCTRGDAPRRKVPRVVHQTFETLVVPVYLLASVGSWLERNPGYAYRYHTGRACRQLLSDAAAELPAGALAAYDVLYPGAYKADLWRLCQVYLHGGVYADIKTACFVGLDEAIAPEDDLVLVQDLGDKAAIYNAWFAAAPRHPLLRVLIEATIANVERRDVEHYLGVTGPWLLGPVVARALGLPPSVPLRPGVYRLPATFGQGQGGQLRILQHAPSRLIHDADGRPLFIGRGPPPRTEREEALFERITGKPHYGPLWRDGLVYADCAGRLSSTT